MDCNERSDREILKSMIGMLFSFAVMAEGVAASSYFMRCYMLWILRRAEASALRCIGLDATSQAWALHRNSSEDALRLAETFREVACWLEDELREDDLFARWSVGAYGIETHDRDLLTEPPFVAPSKEVYAVLQAGPAIGLRACPAIWPP